jgi:hypothetical protein
MSVPLPAPEGPVTTKTGLAGRCKIAAPPAGGPYASRLAPVGLERRHRYALRPTETIHLVWAIPEGTLSRINLLTIEEANQLVSLTVGKAADCL